MKKQKRRVRKISFWRSGWWWRLVLPLFVAAATVVLGTFGYSQLGDQRGQWAINNLWKSTGLILGETSYSPELLPAGNIWLWSARIFGLIIPLYVFLILAYEQLRDLGRRIRVIWFVLMGRIFASRRHVVICGLGWRGSELAHRFLDAGCFVVGIDDDPASSFIADLRGRGAVIFDGNALDESFLRKAKVTSADKIYVMAGDDEVNCRIVCLLDRVMGDFPKPVCLEEMDQCSRGANGEINCVMDPGRCVKGCASKNRRSPECVALVSGYRLRCFLENTTRFTPLNVQTVNLFELAAREFLQQEPLVAVQENMNSPAHVHTVIIGFNEMGKALLIENLKMLHLYPNQKRVVTVYAADCQENGIERKFLHEYPCLRKTEPSPLGEVVDGLFPDIVFEEMPKSNTDWLSDSGCIYSRIAQGWRTNIFVCVDDGMKSKALAHMIAPHLHQRAQLAGTGCEVKIAFFSDYPEDNESVLKEGERSASVRQFGCNIDALEHGAESEIDAMELCYMYELKWSCEEARQSMEKFDHQSRKCFRDMNWITRQEWERDSNRQASDHLTIKLCLLGHAGKSRVDKARLQSQLKDQKTLRLLAEVEHRRWCAERLLSGWQPLPITQETLKKWFEDKDKKKYRASMKTLYKRHIDLVSFDKLPGGPGQGYDEREKDYDSLKMIPDLLRLGGSEEVAIF